MPVTRHLFAAWTAAVRMHGSARALARMQRHGLHLQVTAAAVFAALAVLSFADMDAATQGHLLQPSHAAAKYFPTAAVQPELWQVGAIIRLGDSYTYRICHDVHIVQEIHPLLCYVVRLDFVYHMEHHAYGPVWVADVNFDDKRRTLLLVDEGMRVHPTSSWDRLLARSLENTIMKLSKYGEQRLAVGAHWGDIKTYFGKTPLAVTFVTYDDNGTDSYTSTLGYGGHSEIWIQNDVAFPVYAVWHDPATDALPAPVIEYRYELLDFNGKSAGSRQQGR